MIDLYTIYDISIKPYQNVPDTFLRKRLVNRRKSKAVPHLYCLSSLEEKVEYKLINNCASHIPRKIPLLYLQQMEKVALRHTFTNSHSEGPDNR